MVGIELPLYGCVAHKFAASVMSPWIGLQHPVESMPQKCKAVLKANMALR